VILSLLIQDTEWGSRAGDTRNNDVKGKNQRDATLTAVQGNSN